MFKILLLIILPFLSIFLQSTLFAFYNINNVVPDLVLLFVILYALFYGKNKGAVYGFFCGLLEDLYVGRFIGINALAKALTAYLIGMLQQVFFKESALVGVISVLLGTLINNIIMALVTIIISGHLAISSFTLTEWVLQFAYNFILSIPLYIMYNRSYKKGALQPLEEQ